MIANTYKTTNQAGKNADLVVSYAASWPLLAACAIKRPDVDTLAHEYIIPQMLLRWVVDTHQYDGIRFFSTRVDDFYDDPKTTANYVFPAKTTPKAGYCTELAKMFKLTEPMPWNDAMAQKATKIIVNPR